MNANTAMLSRTIAEGPVRPALGEKIEVLTEIYEPHINIAIWQRRLGSEVARSAEAISDAMPALELKTIVAPEDAFDVIAITLDQVPEAKPVCEDVAQMVDMFCCLFELDRAGIRLSTLEHAMCPRFHVDKIPCRLITTYSGIATEWLEYDLVNRVKLAAGNGGKSDEESGLMRSAADIKQLAAGDVALLKGENWEGNEGAGLVHRSPQVPEGNRRLLLTLDFAQY